MRVKEATTNDRSLTSASQRRGRFITGRSSLCLHLVRPSSDRPLAPNTWAAEILDGEMQLGPRAEEIIRELKKLGFSCIGNVVDWRNEVITQELEEGQEGEPKSVLVPRVTIVPRAELQKATLDAIAEVSQQTNGALRVKMHDKHAALVSLGKHLGLFSDTVQIKAVYGIRDKPMSAEEWKKQFVKPG
jgi:hypothetical protein